MSLILKFPEILEHSREAYETLKLKGYPGPDFQLSEKRGHEGENMLAIGDNADYLCWLLRCRGMSGKLNLIYVDPPFFSKADYNIEIKLNSRKVEKIPGIKQKAYHDTWENGMEDYLRMLILRFYLMKDLLAEDGCFWVHLDWHAVHYVKVFLDEIFGAENFINEVVWQYKSGGTSKRHFARKHDTLLFYAKNKNYQFYPLKEKSYNRGFKPYRFKGVKEYEDNIGWYTMVNQKDVWQLDMVGRTSSERTGYATQKPEALLTRILESCTKKGDLCADFFCGSGTLAATANKMGRNWICCDVGRTAAVGTFKRMVKEGSSFGVYEASMPEQSGESIESERLNALDGSKVLGRSERSKEPKEVSLMVKAEASEDIALGESLVKITLVAYEVTDRCEFPVQEKYVPVLKEAIEENFLQMIEYWSVDMNYDGAVFSGDAFFYREDGHVKGEYIAASAGLNRIAVKAADVFGNTFLVEVELGGHMGG